MASPFLLFRILIIVLTVSSSLVAASVVSSRMSLLSRWSPLPPRWKPWATLSCFCVELSAKKAMSSGYFLPLYLTSVRRSSTSNLEVNAVKFISGRGTLSQAEVILLKLCGRLPKITIFNWSAVPWPGVPKSSSYILIKTAIWGAIKWPVFNDLR